MDPPPPASFGGRIHRNGAEPPAAALRRRPAPCVGEGRGAASVGPCVCHLARATPWSPPPGHQPLHAILPEPSGPQHHRGPVASR